MNREARDLVLACVLGDGWLGKAGDGGILHCAAQLDYLEWKHKLLRKAGVPVGPIRWKDNAGFPAYLFRLRVSKWNKLLRYILYTPSKDYFQPKLLRRLRAVHLAIWYMDDGGLSQKRRDGVVVANDLILNTHTTRENNQVLIDYFVETWGIRFTQVLNRGKYRLRCGTEEARKFINLVQPYVEQVPSMAHKLKVKGVHPSGWKRSAPRKRVKI